MRYRRRHVHETIKQYVIGTLTSQGWVNAPVNFATTPVTVIGHQPLEAGETPPINSVAVTLGDEPPQSDEELGAGLQSQGYTLFVDVWGDSEGLSDSIAGDIKDALVNRIIPLLDFTSNASGDITADTIEFEQILVERVPTATTTVDRRTWRAVKATAICYFQD